MYVDLLLSCDFLYLKNNHHHLQDIAKSLIAARSNLNLRDVKGYTALHWATIMNNQELVMLIMQKGADPNISSHGGVSPLAFAMQANNIEMQNVIYALAKSLNIVLEEPFVMPDDSSDEIKLSIVTVPPVKTRTGSAKKSNVSPGSLMSKRKPSVKQQQAGKAPPAVSSSSSSSREHRPPTPDSTDSSYAQSFAVTTKKKNIFFLRIILSFAGDAITVFRPGPRRICRLVIIGGSTRRIVGGAQRF